MNKLHATVLCGKAVEQICKLVYSVADLVVRESHGDTAGQNTLRCPSLEGCETGRRDVDVLQP